MDFSSLPGPGLKGEVDAALAYIKKKFPNVDLGRRANTQPQKKNKMPDMTQVRLNTCILPNQLISQLEDLCMRYTECPKMRTSRFSSLCNCKYVCVFFSLDKAADDE